MPVVLPCQAYSQNNKANFMPVMRFIALSLFVAAAFAFCFIYEAKFEFSSTTLIKNFILKTTK